ncbi:hypothetical protein PSHT_12924 [Puccinia striiformis]|uniref:Uncharacterized protein n=1 Tax=Puccinia striiformis TaxID=27350 RepID=A0A2S4UTN1_9BASI|nr:hypothetical protein PSHT_12924 [Puccinia striiformis]
MPPIVGRGEAQRTVYGQFALPFLQLTTLEGTITAIPLPHGDCKFSSGGCLLKRNVELVNLTEITKPLNTHPPPPKKKKKTLWVKEGLGVP